MNKLDFNDAAKDQDCETCFGLGFIELFTGAWKETISCPECDICHSFKPYRKCLSPEI